MENEEGTSKHGWFTVSKIDSLFSSKIETTIPLRVLKNAALGGNDHF